MGETRELIERIDDAIDMAVDAHRGQKDKSGQPYIWHPIRVMMAMDTEVEQIVGILHDVVEDSDISLLTIRGAFGGDIHDAVDALTRRECESYPDFISRAGRNPVARRVKIADIRDNLRPGCPPSLRERYETALARLASAED